MALECLNAPIPFVAAPPGPSAVSRWLAGEPTPGAVLYVPLSPDAAVTTPFMVQSLSYGRSIVNGYSGLRPSFFPALVTTLAAFPSIEAVSTVHDLGVQFVVVSRPLTSVPAGSLVERAALADGVVYEVRWTPEAEALLAKAVAVPLPPVFTVPFAVGEAATYAVTWVSGPMAVPAGRATLRVTAGRGARFELGVDATTAPWLARFFQAGDRFVSDVDDSLRPLVFEEHLVEGSRHADRRMTFERAVHAVVLTQRSGVSGIRLPAPADALRVEPRLFRRGLPAVAYTMVVWMSRDARRIPLVAELSGLPGVGVVRLELESYSRAAK